MTMASRIPFVLSSILLLLSSINSTHSSRSSSFHSWCQKTPCPEACEYHISQKSNEFTGNQSTDHDFANIVTHTALHKALHAKNVIMEGAEMVKNDPDKAALSDCSKLLDSTVSRLNLAVNGDAKSASADKQTWLSMALANVETCITGFPDLGILPDEFLLHLAKNVSVLIKNALAVHFDAANALSDKASVPGWASNAYRRLLQGSANVRADFVVAEDGSGNGKTIQEAIDSAPKRRGSGRYVIHVKAGTYDGHVQIDESVKNIVIVGEGIGKTIITGNKRVGGPSSTFQTSTFGVEGDGFIACDITFQNTAGPGSGQAVALMSKSDFSVFYRCSFEGYQDTLYAHSGRQFYRECDIYGTVDFIFGNAAAVFQNCNIYARRPNHDTVVITAQKRFSPHENTGFIIQNSKILASGDLSSVQSYLGRPWGPYSRTVVIRSFIGGFIDPAGWLSWDVHADIDNVYYAEYDNSGPGSSTKNRVNWKGYHAITDPSQASQFTVDNFLSGASWLPATNTPFTLGL